MSKHLQQPVTTINSAAATAGASVRSVSLNAMSALLLVLVLVIIPTYGGVTLIA